MGNIITNTQIFKYPVRKEARDKKQETSILSQDLR